MLREEILALMEALRLRGMQAVYDEVLSNGRKQKAIPEKVLLEFLKAEAAERKLRSIRYRLGQARFPIMKDLDSFRFDQPGIDEAQIRSLYEGAFLQEHSNLIFVGGTGTGKTHLAIAIAYRAIQNGFDALFCTAAALIDTLSEAASCGKLRERLHDYVSPDVLVIDEVGYLSYGPDAANVLFHVVNERHQKKRAMLFTTNKSTDEWGNVLHDHDLADVIVDRILERGRTLKLDGPSYRTKHLGLDGQPQAGVSTKPARISGIQPAEFPEPTHPIVVITCFS